MVIMSARSYAILGTGALGGFYGSRLDRAGLDVHYLLRSDYEHVQSHGLICESPEGDFTLPRVNAYRAVTDMPRCDVVMVGFKTTSNHLLPELLPPVLADDGVVLMTQNGLGMEQQAAAVVGPDRVLGGMAFLCSHKVGPGHIRHLDFGKIALGDYDADDRARGVTDRLRAIGDDFERAGVSVALEPDLRTARWKKLVWNVPFNGLTVALDTTTDRVVAQPETMALSRKLMEEIVAGAAALGRTIPEPFVEKMMADTVKMVAYKPSMKLDYDLGHPLETEAIYGEPLRQAEAAGTDMPTVRALYQQLKFLEERNVE